MDFRLDPEQQRLFELARAEADRIAPVAAALDRGERDLAAELRQVRQSLPETASELELVLAVEQIGRASASLATAYWLSDLATRLGAGDMGLVGAHGLRTLLGARNGSGTGISALPAGAAASVVVGRSAGGLMIGIADARPPALDGQQLSGVRALRLAATSTTVGIASGGVTGRCAGAIVQRAQLAHAAVCLGVAQRALDEACQHLIHRVKMPENQPLATFQGLRFMVADVDAAVESARWPLYAAATSAASTDDAIWLATNAVQLATSTALQIAGGSGFSADRPFERLARDAWALVALVD